MKKIIVYFGKFNPIHKGHWRLFQYVKQKATEENCDYIIASTFHSSFPMCNSEKKEVLESNGFEFGLFHDIFNFFEVDRHKEIELICGSDRKETYEKILNKYNGILFQYDKFSVTTFDRSLSESSTKLKEYIKENDFENFYKLFYNEKLCESKKWFDLLRKRMLDV